MSKPFFYRITAADYLAAIVTVPEADRGQWALDLALDMVAGNADTAKSEFAKSIILEATEFRTRKAKAGAKGGQAKASSAKQKVAALESAVAKPSTPLASSSSSSSSSTVTEPKPKTLLPDYISQESMSSFQEMRKKIKKPMTDRALVLLIGKLEKFHADGYDVNEILDNSTLGCWAGVFEPKEKKATVIGSSSSEENRIKQEWAERQKKEMGI